MDPLQELGERFDRSVRRYRSRPKGRSELALLREIIEEQLEIIRELVHLVHHHRNQPRRVIVQVVLNDTQKVLLHAQEDNAEGEPIDRDSATAVWTSDRQDIVTLAPSDDGFSCEATTVGGIQGDTLVTVTLTESGGQTYVGTQVVTVALDETIASVEITADAPEQK